jgi:hypothetical protein
METIQLSYPVEVSGVKVDRLTLRRPKVRDTQAAEKAGNGQAYDVALLAALCDVEPSAIQDLDLADFKKLQEVVQGFIG